MINNLKLTLVPFILYYFYTIIIFIYGIVKKTSTAKINNNKLIGISVIVAVRNGQKNLSKLFKSLTNQTYLGNMEFIFVDDESTDQTKDFIKQWEKKDSRIKYQTSLAGDKQLSYKKKAVDAGIKIAKNNFFAFTDVDCLPTKNWVQGIAKGFNNGGDYIVGLSVVPSSSQLISIFQRMDFQGNQLIHSNRDGIISEIKSTDLDFQGNQLIHSHHDNTASFYLSSQC